MEYYGPSFRSDEPSIDKRHTEHIRPSDEEADIAIRAITHRMTSGLTTVQASWYGKNTWTFSRHIAAVEQAMDQYADDIANGNALVEKFGEARRKPEDRRMVNLAPGELYWTGIALWHFGHYVCRDAMEAISNDDCEPLGFVEDGADYGQPVGKDQYLTYIGESQEQARSLYEQLQPIGNSNNQAWSDWDALSSRVLVYSQHQNAV